MYYKNGVILTPNVAAEGDKATVVYKGLLKDSGADSVYMCLGYGDNWDKSQYIQMKKTNEGFEAQVPVTSHEQLHLAFKDGAGNWDNNTGRNYSFQIQDRTIL